MVGETTLWLESDTLTPRNSCSRVTERDSKALSSFVFLDRSLGQIPKT